VTDTLEEASPDGGGRADDRPGLALAKAIDELWTEIQSNHPEVPECALFVSPVAHGKDTKKFTVLGHFGKDRWQTRGGDTVGEVVLVAEHLARGGEDVLETVLHEAAHALCAARGLKDTSQNGRYHNAVFAAAARELGLEVSLMPGGHGMAHTVLADGTGARYGAAIKALDKAVIAAKKAKARDDERRKRAGGPVKCVCRCEPARSFRMSPSVLAAGDVTCGQCGTAFFEAPKPAAAP
jgi:hypothetical protein